jgi:uncharacterized membrane protein
MGSSFVNHHSLTTTQIVRIAIIAALYAVFTIGIAPLSYGPIQFRVAEAFKVFVLFDPLYAVGIGIGTFFGNLASPFVGPWELVFMPLSDTAGGLLAWWLYRLLRRRWPVVPLALYAVTTSLSVGLMLTALGEGGFWALAGLVAISELIILIAGYPLIMGAVRLLRSRGIELESSVNQ